MRAFFPFRHVVIVFAISLTMTAHSQTKHSSHVVNSRHSLPGMTDWFLSTGNWHSDPQLYVYEFGQGTDTLVMLHGGWGGEYSGLIDPVRDLGQQFHFIFYDQRGSLRSPVPDSLITFEHHVNDLELLRKELGLRQLHLVGHSMGAILASAYAAAYPAHIRQLTLIAPPFLIDPLPQQDKDLQHQGYLASQSFINRPQVKDELDKYRLQRTHPPLSSKEETSKFRIIFGARMLYDVSNWPKLTGGRALHKGHVYNLTSKTYPASGWDFISEFKKREYTVNIIAGDHDFLDFNNSLIKKWSSGIPNVKVTVIANAGHVPWLDQPKAFVEALQTSIPNKNNRAR